MPDRPPSEFDSESDWTAYCVPFMIDEDMPQNQAVAACLQMWRDRNKAALPAVDRAWSVLTVKSVDLEQRTIEGIATTPSVDRVGDIVEPLGATFSLPLPLLHHHRHDQPVGHVTAARATEAGIAIKAVFARITEPGSLKERIDTAWQECKAGLVRGLSIGFKPLEYEFLDDNSGGLRFTKYSLLELSLVTVPANADCTISLVRSLDAALSAASGHSTNRPGASGKRSINLKLSERTMSKTIAEQIAALEAKRAANEARMNDVMTKAVEEGRSTDDAEKEEFDTLQREIEELDGDLKRFKALERVNLAKAVPVSAANSIEDGAKARSGGAISITSPKLPQGIAFARVARCIGLARGNLVAAQQIAEATYSDDRRIGNVLKAAVSAGTTMDATWAGPLVSDEGAVFADFLEFLRPMTILGKFGTGNVPSLREIPFRVPIGSQTSGGTAYWTREAGAKGLTKFDFARTTLEPLKVAAITVVTDELLKYAALPAEALLRDQLAAAVAEKVDTDFIDPSKTAVANVSPASITNGVSTVASSGVTADAVRADVMALFDIFIAADNPASSAVWIMSASTAGHLMMMYNSLGTQEFNSISMNGGTFAGYPVIVSEYVGTSGGSPNTRYVWLVNAKDIFFADEGVRVDVSREASLVMDTAPTTMHGAELGSPSAPLAAAMVSMWQTNMTAFLCERTLNWARARTEAVQGLSGVVWGT